METLETLVLNWTVWVPASLLYLCDLLHLEGQDQSRWDSQKVLYRAKEEAEMSTEMKCRDADRSVQ